MTDPIYGAYVPTFGITFMEKEVGKIYRSSHGKIYGMGPTKHPNPFTVTCTVDILNAIKKNRRFKKNHPNPNY